MSLTAGEVILGSSGFGMGTSFGFG